MISTNVSNTSFSSPQKNNSLKHRVNWHEAAFCAIQIELRNYADMLEFQNEYILGKNSYRIDFLVVKKPSAQPIPKNIARDFVFFNLFEIKGIHSSLTVNSYYKTIGYAGLLIDQASGTKQYSSLDIHLSFLSFSYPRKLMKHLQKERHLMVANSSPGIYDIYNETFKIQIIVTQRLPPEENLYLCCLTNHLTDAALIRRLSDDYARYKNQDIYTKYLHQLTTANIKTQGETNMVCEGLFNLFGTSSEEIIAHAKEEADDYYLPKLNELTASNNQLTASNNQLISEIEYLKNLLVQNNISFKLD